MVTGFNEFKRGSLTDSKTQFVLGQTLRVFQNNLKTLSVLFNRASRAHTLAFQRRYFSKPFFIEQSIRFAKSPRPTFGSDIVDLS